MAWWLSTIKPFSDDPEVQAYLRACRAIIYAAMTGEVSEDW